jgi:hypothetical protein
MSDLLSSFLSSIEERQTFERTLSSLDDEALILLKKSIQDEIDQRFRYTYLEYDTDDGLQYVEIRENTDSKIQAQVLDILKHRTLDFTSAKILQHQKSKPSSCKVLHRLCFSDFPPPEIFIPRLIHHRRILDEYNSDSNRDSELYSDSESEYEETPYFPKPRIRNVLQTPNLFLPPTKEEVAEASKIPTHIFEHLGAEYYKDEEAIIDLLDGSGIQNDLSDEELDFIYKTFKHFLLTRDPQEVRPRYKGDDFKIWILENLCRYHRLDLVQDWFEFCDSKPKISRQKNLCHFSSCLYEACEHSKFLEQEKPFFCYLCQRLGSEVVRETIRQLNRGSKQPKVIRYITTIRFI